MPTRSVSVSSWARDALTTLTELPGVRRAGLALAEGGGRRLRFTASDRDPLGAVEWCHVDAYDDVPLNSAVRTGEAVLSSLDGMDAKYAVFVDRQRGSGTVALAAVPVVAAGQTLGGYVLFFEAPQPFDVRQRHELARLGGELGETLRRAQRGEERGGVSLHDDPVPAGAVVAFHDGAPDPAGVGKARRFLRTVLGAWGIDEETADTAVLCLSELVSNVVIHAHADYVVRVLLEDGVLTTTVRDSGAPDTGPAEPLSDPMRVHGRGLQLVDAFASRWGSELDTAGTTVWFVLEHDACGHPTYAESHEPRLDPGRAAP